MTKILVTRPDPDAELTAARLAGLGFDPVIAPLLKMQSIKASLPTPKGLGGVVATSANALRALDAESALSPYLDLPLYAVGEKTSATAKSLGFEKTVTTGHNAAEMVEFLKTEPGNAPLFYPHADHVSLDLAEALAPSGRLVLGAIVYAMHPVETLGDDIIAALGTDIPAVAIYSHRTARIFCTLAGEKMSIAQKRALSFFALSQNAATPLVAGRFARIQIADHPSEEAMLALALSFLRAQNRS